MPSRTKLKEIRRRANSPDFIHPWELAYQELYSRTTPDVGVDDEEEIERRKAARSHMRHYIPYTFPEYKQDAFHLQVCDDIDRVVFPNHPRPITHLMLNAPPQHGKSEIVSTRLPSFWLANNPDLPVALVSYAQDLANRNSRQARWVFESDEFFNLFGTRGILKDQDNWRVRDWHLSAHVGYVFAVGVGGPITGRGFGCCIIDDPIENWAAAQSEALRASVWDWWKGTLKTRMWEGHRMIFMMTRWHEDDLQSRILKQEGRRDQCVVCGFNFMDDYDPKLCPECGGNRGKWMVRSYSALAESQEERDEMARQQGLREGLRDILGREHLQPLAPQMFSKEYLIQQSIDVGALVWGAEYQQHPTPPKGDFFKVGMVVVASLDQYPLDSFGGRIETYRDGRGNVYGRPVQLRGRVVRFWDLAASEKKKGVDPDFTSGTLIGIDKDGYCWILDQISFRGEPQHVEQLIKETARLDGKYVHIMAEQEGGASGKSMIWTLGRMLPGYKFDGKPSTGDKTTRAYWFAAYVNKGYVRLLGGQAHTVKDEETGTERVISASPAPWHRIWLERHRVFPYGTHDDEVDSSAGGFNWLTGEKKEWAEIPFTAL